MDAYMYQAAFLCPASAEVVMEQLAEEGKAPANPEDEYTYDSDDYPKGPYPDGGGEADSWQRCDKCNIYLGNGLTGDGALYEAQAMQGVEIFKMSAEDIQSYGRDSCWYNEDDQTFAEPGYYFWYCQPGCLPDSNPRGPYSELIAACQDIVDENWPEEGTTY